MVMKRAPVEPFLNMIIKRDGINEVDLKKKGMEGRLINGPVSGISSAGFVHVLHTLYKGNDRAKKGLAYDV